MGPRELLAFRDKKRFEVLLRALLRMVANRVERAILLEGQRVLGVSKIVFGLFNPLTHNLKRRAHKGPVLPLEQAG